jgi:peptidoglycan/xylan/chitin deacetylase (PgdA/CDA1 family)
MKLFIPGFLCLALVMAQTPTKSLAPSQAHHQPFDRTVIYLTYDDGPDVYSAEIARWLAADGIRATFFVNLCRFVSANLTSMWTGNCFPQPGSLPISTLNRIASFGHVLGNHTYDHVDLTQSGLPAAEPRYQFESAQRVLDSFQGSFHPFRAPYLKWTPALDEIVREDPYLSRMTGPIGCDYCGGGYVQGTAVSGDWDCLAKGFGVRNCGQMYVDAIESLASTQNHIVVLLHDRLTGRNIATNQALLLTRYIVRKLGKERFEFRALSPNSVVPVSTY